MSVYDTIVNPASGRRVSIFGPTGSKLLKSYVEQVAGGYTPQRGGARGVKGSGKPKSKCQGLEERACLDKEGCIMTKQRKKEGGRKPHCRSVSKHLKKGSKEAKEHMRRVREHKHANRIGIHAMGHGGGYM